MNEPLPRALFAREEQRDVRDAVVFESLPRVTLGLGLLYTFFAVSHFFALPPRLAGSMSALAAGTALAFFTLRVLLARNVLRPSWAHPLGAFSAGLVLLNCLTHLYLERNPHQSTNVLLLIAGMSLLYLSSRWFVFSVLVVWAGWGLTVRALPPSPLWSHFAFALFTVTVLAVIVHQVRVRTRLQLEELRRGLERQVRERTTQLSHANQYLRDEIAARQQADERAAATSQLLAALIDAIPVYISYVGADERYQFVNKLYETWFARPRAEIVGRTLREVMGEAIYQIARPQLAQALAGQTVRYEFWAQDHGGGERFLEVNYVPHFDSGGQVRGFFSMVADRTEKKLADEAQLRLERKLLDSQKRESLGVLAGGVAHDFNNLLTGILGNANLARLDLPPNSPVQTSLEQIEKNSARAATLCQQMLAYAGRGRFQVSRLNLNLVLKDTLDLMQISIGKKVQLKFALAEDLPAIMADAAQMHQIILNLITNASEAIGTGRGEITIRTGKIHATAADFANTHLAPELPSGDYVYLEVSDTGCGMPPDTQAKIFDPFFTTKFTGRGLGLAAVLGIVRGHQGAIQVSSELDRGSAFRVMLPVPENPAGEFRVDPSGESNWRGDGVVLVADDEETMRTVSGRMLASLGLRPVITRDGHEALARFREQPQCFDLVLLDLTMPKMDGVETFCELRRIRPDVRVLLMSGYNEEEAVGKFAGQGLAGFLQKPFNFGRLQEKLRELLATAPRA